MNGDKPDNHTEPERVEHEALATDSAGAHVDLDAFMPEWKRLRRGKGMTEQNILAFQRFSQTAKAGDVEAQYCLGLCYLNGDGIQQDNTKSVTWLEQSASAGFTDAMMCLAGRYLIGKPFPKNDDEAIKWFHKAADAGSKAACVLLAIIYADRKDAPEELKWNKEAALRGCFDSLWDVRKFYERKEGVKMDLVEAYVWLSLYEDTFTRRKLSRELWAFQLSPDISKYKTSSLDLIAIMSASEIEQAGQLYRDCIKHRVKWIRKKAKEGSRNAQYEIGWCYRDGYGALQDNAEAVRWWQMAAEQGDKMAQNNLGHCYKYAEGVEENHEEAVRWFRKSAEQGYDVAQYNLGHSYCMGLGVPQDDNEGAKWIRRAAESGDRAAQHNMGFLCKNGYGVPRDNAQALAWYRSAAAQGNANAQEEADKLAISMSPMELERASQFYGKFEHKHTAKQ